MNRSILGYAVILLVIMLVFVGCGQADGNVSDASQNNKQSVYSDLTVTNDPSKTGVTDVTSVTLQSITKEMSFSEVFELLGETKDFGFLYTRIYTVDTDKLLVIRFDSLEQVCDKSGEELLKTTIPLHIPAKAVELTNETQYGKFGVMVDGSRFFCIEELECYEVWIGKATITDQNGNAFSADNIENMTYLFVQYNRIMETYPAILDCTKAVVFNS